MSSVSKKLDVILGPRELSALSPVDLLGTVCVVFDILRATSSMITALANGAEKIFPVAEIAEAVAIFRQLPTVLLAGERNGFPPTVEQTGGVEFHFGNSPRAFTADRVRAQTIAWTTTNGTRAMKACSGAQRVFVSAFLNLEATARWIQIEQPDRLLLVCSGTHEEAAAEDVWAAGALCHRIEAQYPSASQSDAASIAQVAYQAIANKELAEALGSTRNGRRLVSIPTLRDDVAVCARRDSLELMAELKDGVLRRI